MNTNNPTVYDKGTPAGVRDILEHELHSGHRLRLFYGDQETGQDWHEEYGTQGYIGKSTGTQPCALLVNNARSTGGPAILTACIVKITENGRTLYQHPNYHHGTHTVGAPTDPGYVESVNRDGAQVAQFTKSGQARRWIDYIEGHRASK